MAGRTRTGTCHLCLETKPLSFEHVPPEGAFNGRPVLQANFEKLLGKDLWQELQAPRGRTQQRGAGAHTLCVDCNVQTGNFYSRAYADFVEQVMPAVSVADAGDDVIVPVRIQALRVFKQIVTMFCSACGPGFATKRPAITRYLLNRESRDLPEGIAINLALQDRKSMAARQSGITARMDTQTGQVYVYSEIAFPPLDIVMSLASPRPHPFLFDVTWLNRYSYDEWYEGGLPLRCVQTNTYLPAEYSNIDRLREISERDQSS
jgi:hypothetical protein